MKKIIIYYFLFLFFGLSIFSSGVVDSQDGFQYLAVARNIYYKGKPIMPPYEFDTRQNIHMSTLPSKDGNYYSFTGLGFSLALLPAVAATDIFYKIYNISPPVHFPLENDWLILLFASFTNNFFGAILGTTLFLYFIQLKIPKKQALFLSLISIISTNLFVYTKHINAHMMFVSMLTLSFYFLRLYSTSNLKKYLIFSSIAYGIMMLSYNGSYLLTVLPYLVYYLLLTKPTLSFIYIKKILIDFLFFAIPYLPFALINIGYEILRSPSFNSSFASPVALGNYAQNNLLKTPITILFEGIYGQLFSPGRSFFLYSPLILIIFIFWFKIKKAFRPELCVFLLISIIYILFYGAQFTVGKGDQGIAAVWHGESSWGPRYLTPLIPFGMLIVGIIFIQLKKFQKILIFLPLAFIGFYLEIIGVLIPYQVKFHNLETGKFIVNSTEFTMYSYINIIPRFTPIIPMSKNLIKLPSAFLQALNHSKYNVRFFDGIDFPFNVGPERWRVIENHGYINFNNKQSEPINIVRFGMINHVMGESSSSAKISFLLNSKPITNEPIGLLPRERNVIELPVPKNYLIRTNNLLEVIVKYDNPKVASEKTQILGIISMSINDQNINLESLDFPYVSELGPAMTNTRYGNYGGSNKDRWKLWEIHTQMFERLPDFWWIRNLLYWDIPKGFIITLISIDFMFIVVFGFLLKKELKK